MKQVNFSHSGGFPLEQETLERLQTAYRSELFAALKSHLSIEKDTNYIVALATEEKTGWAIIHQDETDAAEESEGILYPIQKGNNTHYLKTTRTGTNLTYGDGTSQTAYFDYDAVYITESEFNTGVAQNSDALTVNYYALSTFKAIKDIQSVENSIESIEADIDLINQTYLPLDGSKAMKGDFSMTKRGSLQPNSTGRTLVDSSDATATSLSLNYQSDWQNTIVGGKVYFDNLNTSIDDFKSSESPESSLLLIDNVNQVSKNNNLLKSLLSRITDLEEKQGTAIPIGMIAIWGKPAPFPEGWEEYVPLRGRMPIGLDPDDINFSTLGTIGGNKNKKLSIAELPKISPINGTGIKKGGTWGSDKGLTVGDIANGDYLEGELIKPFGGDQEFSLMNPYRIVQFIEYTGRPSDQTDLSASDITDRSLTLNWTASADNVAVSNYMIYKNGTLLATVAGSVLSYAVTGLTAVTPYSFYVIAKDAAENLLIPSNTVDVTTTIADTIAPTMPTGLRCYPTSENHITIEWNPSTDNVKVDHYIVSRRYPDGSSDVIKAAKNICVVLGTLGITYYFKVNAFDAAGNFSSFTNEVAGVAISGAGDPGEEDPGNSCFDVESLVTMASGQSKKLKNIVIGDKLQGFSFPNEIDESDGDYMVWNGKLNEAVKAEVIVVNKTTSIQPDYYEIKTADTTIKVTGQHPLLVTEDGENVQWVCTKDVLQSMLLIDKVGSTKAIESIVFKEEPLEVALLDVENVDNYVISGIVAHNSKPQDPHDPQP
jgi:hypothetical protein